MLENKNRPKKKDGNYKKLNEYIHQLLLSLADH